MTDLRTRTQPDEAAKAVAPTSSRSHLGRLLWLSFVGVALVALAQMFSFRLSDFISAEFPNRPTPRDLLFETLPYFDAGQYTTDFALLAALLLLLGYALARERDQIPSMLGAFALFYFLRAAIMVLTPLASAHGNGEHFGIVPLIQNGMFPSGHTGAALLCVLFVDPKRAPAVRRVEWVLGLVVWSTLLLSHGHYSIDIVGGLLLAYFVRNEWAEDRLFGPLKRLLRV